MKLSQFRSQLAAIEAKHGDIDVVLSDADTGWYWLLVPAHLMMDQVNGRPRLVIGGDYGNELAPEPDQS